MNNSDAPNLREILHSHRVRVLDIMETRMKNKDTTDYPPEDNRLLVDAKFEAQIQALINEVLGEDEEHPKDCHNWLIGECDKTIRNQLRSELRENFKAKGLLP